MEGLRIRQERLLRGWTQQYVATQISLTRTAVHDIEIGKQLPSFRVLVKLEDLFDMDYRDLFNIPQR